MCVCLFRADDDTLIHNKLLRQEFSGGVASLTIASLEPCHEGVYECAAQNCAGSAAAAVSLTVKGERCTAHAPALP